MSEPTAHGLAAMPPWGWGLLLLGSGGGIGTLSGLSLESHENCVEREELIQAQGQLQGAHSSLDAANATILSLIEVIKDHNKSEGWIE